MSKVTLLSRSHPAARHSMAPPEDNQVFRTLFSLPPIQTSVPRGTQSLDGQEFAADRSSIHTEIMALLTRTLAKLSKAASHYPQIAAEVEQIASTVTVAQKKIEEIHPPGQGSTQRIRRST